MDNYEEDVLSGFVVEDRKYVIYGTGKVANIYYNKIVDETTADNIVFFINEVLDINEYMDKPVYKCKEVPDEIIKDEDVYFITATMSAIPIFNEKLREIGIKSERIINPTMVFSRTAFILDKRPLKRVIIYPELKSEQILFEKIDEFNCLVVKEHFESVQFVFLSDCNYKGVLRDDFKIISFNDFATDVEDYYWIWDARSINDDFLKDKKRKTCCDDSFIMHGTVKMHLAMNNKITKNRDIGQLKGNYERMAKMIEGYEYSVVCGMGPSLLDMNDEVKSIVNNGCKIVCNGFFKVETDIMPQIFTFQDPDFFAYNNRTLFDKTVKHIIENNMFMVVEEEWTETLLQIYPDLMNNLVILKRNEEMCFPTRESQTYKFAENVVPGLCIPIVSGIANEVYIIGCDGLNGQGGWALASGEEEDISNYDNNSEGTSFLVMNNINNQVDYSNRVEEIWKEVLEYGESKNVSYKSLMRSSYVELNKRYYKY